VDVQPLQDEPPPDDLKSPAALLKLQADMTRLTLPPHCGHTTSSLPNTSFSNSPHLLQLYS